MIELKIACPSCGQKYKFDLVPVEGRMPFEVECPVCKVNGTQAANAALAAMQLEKLPPSAPPAAAPAPGPVPVAASTAMRVGGPPVVPPASAPIPLPPLVPAQTLPQKNRPAPTGVPSFKMGIFGAGIGALVGMIAWIMIVSVTHFMIGWAAIGLGALTGFSARYFGKHGSQALGITAAICSALAILLGQFVGLRSITAAELPQMAAEAYDEQIVYAKEALQATNDDQIIAAMDKKPIDLSDASAESHASNTSEKALQNFRTKEMPKLRKFVSGQPSRSEFERKKIEEMQGAAFLVAGAQLIRIRTLIWLFLGVGSAFRVANRV